MSNTPNSTLSELFIEGTRLDAEGKHREACAHHRRGFELKYPDCTVAYARAHYWGLGVAKHNNTADDLFYIAMRLGVKEVLERNIKNSSVCEYYLGFLYQKGFCGIEINLLKAKDLYESAAAKGDASAINSLGYMYITASGIAMDKKKGQQLWEKASKLQDTLSIHNMGHVYSYGSGVSPSDKKKAKYYYEIASERGLGEGSFGLALLHIDQDGLEFVEEGFRLYQLSLTQGCTTAIMNLSVYYRDGLKGLLQCDELSLQYCLLAFDSGKDPLAAAELARRFFVGEGVARNLCSAAYYAAVGASQKQRLAVRLVQRAELTPYLHAACIRIDREKDEWKKNLDLQYGL